MVTRHRHALGALIAGIQEANGWSYTDVAHNASVAGRSLSKSRVEVLRNHPVDSIGGKAIRDLAAGLQVTPQQVALAAFASMGYPVDQPTPTAAEILASDPDIAEPVRRVLLAALRAAYGASRPRGDHHDMRARRRARLDEGAIQSSAADDDLV